MSLKDNKSRSSSIREFLKTHGDNSWLTIFEDVHAIPLEDHFIIYAPTRRLAYKIDGPDFLDFLSDVSLFKMSNHNTSEGLSYGDKTSLLNKILSAEISRFDSTRDRKVVFSPTRLTLSPTSKCPLICSYCYINGGDRSRNMPWVIAESAINIVSANALKLDSGKFTVNFHGQGEPTANWSLLKRSVDYSNLIAKKNSTNVDFTIVTNGIINQSQVEFLINNRFLTTISIDGMKDVQDQQRPMKNGKGSFKHVMRTISKFEELGGTYGIQCTVTLRNVKILNDFIKFIGTNTRNCKGIFLETVVPNGRGAVDYGSAIKNLEESYLNGFKSNVECGKKYGLLVEHSGCQVQMPRTSFCSAYGEDLNFCVSTEGLVSSCYEVLEKSDPRAEIFSYGHFDHKRGEFDFNMKRINRLKNLHVDRISRCQGCFSKWNCAGGCIAGMIQNNKPLPENIFSSNSKCELYKGVTLRQLDVLASKNINHRR